VVVFGVAELIPLRQISTSLLERLNGAIRRRVAPLRRKTRSFAKQLTVKRDFVSSEIGA
jgi:hypothetical protein